MITQPTATEVRRALGNVKFPATKQQLIEEARKQDISEDVINILLNCPERRYNTSEDVVLVCNELY